MVSFECKGCGSRADGVLGGPDECEGCGGTEFVRLDGPSGILGLDVDSFVRICVVLIPLNLVLGLLAVVSVGGTRALGAAMASVVVLGTLAWLNARRSRVGWLLGLGVSGLAGLGGGLLVLGRVGPGGPVAAAAGVFVVAVAALAVVSLLGSRDVLR